MEQLKEIKQPLGLYDVFGYILPGFLLFSLIIIDNDVNPIIQRIFENDENLLIMNDLFSVKLYSNIPVIGIINEVSSSPMKS